MKPVSNMELEIRLKQILDNFSTKFIEILLKQESLEYLGADDSDEEELFYSRFLAYAPSNLLSSLLDNKELLPKGNFLLYLLKMGEFYIFQGVVISGRWKATLSRKELRSYIAECLQYVRRRVKVCDEFERRFLMAFVIFVKLRGAQDRFFPVNSQIQTEVPIPKEVKVLNVDNQDPNETMATCNFIEALKSVNKHKSF